MSRHRIPVPTALYRLYDADSNLLYVGITTQPTHRFVQHRKKQTWWPEVARTEIRWLPSFDAAAEVEREAIQTEQPRHNTRFHPVNGPACVEVQLETRRRNKALRPAERESA